jgi:hypothetical protein
MSSVSEEGKGNIMKKSSENFRVSYQCSERMMAKEET